MAIGGYKINTQFEKFKLNEGVEKKNARDRVIPLVCLKGQIFVTETKVLNSSTSISSSVRK